MKQKDVMKTMGWAGAAAGAALAVGYFLQTDSGSKRWKSLSKGFSRGVRGLMDSAGGELTRLGREVGILDARKTSHSTRSSRALADSGDAAESGSERSGKSSRRSGSRSSLKKSGSGKRTKKST